MRSGTYKMIRFHPPGSLPLAVRHRPGRRSCRNRSGRSAMGRERPSQRRCRSSVPSLNRGTRCRTFLGVGGGEKKSRINVLDLKRRRPIGATCRPWVNSRFWFSWRRSLQAIIHPSLASVESPTSPVHPPDLAPSTPPPAPLEFCFDMTSQANALHHGRQVRAIPIAWPPCHVHDPARVCWR